MKPTDTFQENDICLCDNPKDRKELLEYAESRHCPIFDNSFLSDFEEFPHVGFDGVELCCYADECRIESGYYFLTPEQFRLKCDNWKAEQPTLKPQDESGLSTEEQIILNDLEEMALNPLLGAIKDKLLKNERKYGFGDAWMYDDWKEELQKEIRSHTEKGDPLDVAIYAMFAHYHGWSLSEQPTLKEQTFSEGDMIDFASFVYHTSRSGKRLVFTFPDLFNEWQQSRKEGEQKSTD